jgi:hypothetical protein
MMNLKGMNLENMHPTLVRNDDYSRINFLMARVAVAGFCSRMQMFVESVQTSRAFCATKRLDFVQGITTTAKCTL